MTQAGGRGPGWRHRSRATSFSRTAVRPGLAATVAASVLLATGACTHGPAPPSAGSATAELTRLQRSTALLERQLELASGKEFYLVLDPTERDLTLMLRGAALRRFTVLGLQIGFPRIAWGGRRAAPAWQGVIWSNGELDPPRPIDRIVITPEEGGKDGSEPATPPIPPTAEELYRVPARFHVRFSSGLSVEIRPHDADADAGRLARLRTWWSAKWGDVMAALGSQDRDAVRLRVILSPADAGSLYRSLPPGVRLLVLSGEPAPARTPTPAGASPR
jgi:hypothetical protein